MSSGDEDAGRTSRQGDSPEVVRRGTFSSRGENTEEFWAGDNAVQVGANGSQEHPLSSVAGHVPLYARRPRFQGPWISESATAAAVDRGAPGSSTHHDQSGVGSGDRATVTAAGPAGGSRTGMPNTSEEPWRWLGGGSNVGEAGTTVGSDLNESVSRTLSETTGGSSAPMFPSRRRSIFRGPRARRQEYPEGFLFWPGRGAGGATVAGGESSGTARANGGADVGADNPQTDAQDGRILFYHKPTLANDSTGDIPDAVPVYLGCPGGGMALGLPLNEAWQGGEQQDTTFNHNLSYTILSWPERHAKDLMEIRRQQVLFVTAMVFNLLVVGLFYLVENPDRTKVEPPARVGSFPGPFEQRVGSDAAAISRAEDQHLLAALFIGLWGMCSVVTLSSMGIVLYLCCTVVNVIIGLGSAPDALLACRFMVDAVLVVIARSLLSAMTHAWITAAAGDGR